MDDGSCEYARFKVEENQPTTDTLTHIELYRAFPFINGIAHSHARWCTIFSQMGLGIPALGTTHADYFHGEIPCTRKLRAYEIRGDYERETGSVIVERFQKGKLDPEEMPGALVCNHGPYTWGRSPKEAVNYSVVMEEVAFMAWHCMFLPTDTLFQCKKIYWNVTLVKTNKNRLKNQIDTDTNLS